MMARSYRSESRNLTASGYVGRAGLWLWTLIPITFPIYLFAPGGPQLSSYLVVVITVLLVGSGVRFPENASSILILLTWFVWYVCLVNLVWALLTGISGFLVPPLYYFFNAIALILTLVLYAKERDRFLVYAERAIVVSIAIQVAALFLVGSNALRAVAFFDNPNQLGYFALIAAAIFLTLTDNHRTSNWYRGAVLSGCLFMVLTSASFAALGGFIFLAIIVLRKRPLLAVVATAAMLSLVSLHPEELFLSDRIESESEELEETSFWASRGYDRILNHPEHIVLGAGEGNYRAYRSEVGKHEIHSSYGTLFFSYGIVGLLLFLSIIYSVARKAGIGRAQYLFPVLIYGFAHQGLRSTMLWILMGLVWCVGSVRHRAREGAPPEIAVGRQLWITNLSNAERPPRSDDRC